MQQSLSGNAMFQHLGLEIARNNQQDYRYPEPCLIDDWAHGAAISDEITSLFSIAFKRIRKLADSN
jgi:hypothetical protein